MSFSLLSRYDQLSDKLYSVIVIVAIVFLGSSQLFLKTRPHGSPIVDAARTVSIAISEQGFENAKPSLLQEHGRLERYPFATRADYTDYSVEKVRTGITACKVTFTSQMTLEKHADEA